MSTNIFTYFFKHFIVWMLVFILARSIFLVYNIGHLQGLSPMEILETYIYGFRLDLSMAGYFLGLTFFLILFSSLFKKKWIAKLNRWYTCILLVAVSIITVSELEIYKEWATKLDVKALKFLEDPVQVFFTVRPVFLFGGIAAIITLSFAFIWLYKKVLRVFEISSSWKKNTVFVMIIPIILVLGIRGGLKPIPIQQSDVYFSQKNILNLAAVNSSWNLLHSIIENSRSWDGNPYAYFDLKEAQSTVEEMHKIPKDTAISILTTQRPNIIQIVLEGWSADLIKSLGGYEGITPNFEKLISDGLLFTNIYASGSLSDQGMCCIFSGFPAQPKTCIIAQPGKYNKLPCFTRELKKAGYYTSFLFGGQLSYGNIKAYMYHNNFDKVQDEADFNADIPRGRLAIQDEYLFQKQLQDFENIKEPFFAAMFTASTHSPFDIPMKEVLDWGGNEKQYINSAYYADREIIKFINACKKFSWYDSTLFVIVPDHSHNSPRSWAFNQPEYRKIPMLFFGNVLKPEYRGYKYSKLCSQIDLPVTLLKQLGMDATSYKWSKNLFNPFVPEFAYYETTDGFGWLRPNQQFVYVHSQKREEYVKAISDSTKKQLEKEGKAYLQVLYQEYLDY